MTPADINALIARLERARESLDREGVTIKEWDGSLYLEAAAALRELQEENARLRAERDIAMAERHPDWNLLERVEAERDALQKIVDIANPPEGKVDMVALVSQVASKEIIEMALHVVRAERDALKVEVATLAKDSERLHWLHSPASCQKDIYECEWGIWRVSWDGGRASHVWATNSDFSDLDAAIDAARKGKT